MQQAKGITATMDSRWTNKKHKTGFTNEPRKTTATRTARTTQVVLSKSDFPEPYLVSSYRPALEYQDQFHKTELGWRLRIRQETISVKPKLTSKKQ